MYHSMQLHFSSEMEKKKEDISARDNEKVDMEKTVADANQQAEDAFATIKRLLAAVTVNDDSLIDVTHAHMSRGVWRGAARSCARAVLRWGG